MKVVLVNPPVWDISTPPINIAYLSAYLKHKKYRVKAFDFNVELYHYCKEQKYWGPGYLAFWSEKERYEHQVNADFRREIVDYITGKIVNENPTLVGFTINYSPHLVLEVSRELKKVKPGIKIIVGGNYAEQHFFGGYLLNSGFVDAAVLGEGEVTLLEIAERIKNHMPFNDIDGILTIKNGSIVENPRRQKILKPDELPFPDFSDFDLNLLVNQDTKKPEKKLPLLFSRGCVNNCDFCAQTRIWGKPFVMRSGRDMFLEVMRDFSIYGVRKFQFSDLAINFDLKKLGEFCDLIISNNLDIEWGAGAVIRPDMDLEYFKKLKRAGCRWLDVGLESGSNHVLKEMGKPFTTDMALEYFRKASLVGLTVTTSMIVGHPAETREYFNETLEFLKHASKYLKLGPSVSLCGVYPKTTLYEKMRKYGAKPGEDIWVEWKVPGNDYNERLKRLKELNAVIKEYIDNRGLRIPNKEVYQYET